MTAGGAILALGILSAACFGVGIALQKRGLTRITETLGVPDLSHAWRAGMRRRLGVAIVTTPLFLVGLLLSSIVSGGCLMVALSMGDGAKTGVFITALASACAVVANVTINGERLRPLHVVGMLVAIGGASLVAAGGFLG